MWSNRVGADVVADLSTRGAPPVPASVGSIHPLLITGGSQGSGTLNRAARESWPLLDYYRGRPTFRSVNGAQPPDRVAAELASKLDAMVPVRTERVIR